MSTGGGRTTFLGDASRSIGPAWSTRRRSLGEVEAIELVTVGQRKGIGLPGGGPKRYVVDVDTAQRVVMVGDDADLLRPPSTSTRDVGGRSRSPVDVLVQCSAHGDPRRATVRRTAGRARTLRVEWDEPQRRIAPGQSVVVVRPDRHGTSLGGGIAT